MIDDFTEIQSAPPDVPRGTFLELPKFAACGAHPERAQGDMTYAGDIPERCDHAQGEFLQVDGAHDAQPEAEVLFVIQADDQMVELRPLHHHYLPHLILFLGCKKL